VLPWDRGGVTSSGSLDRGIDDVNALLRLDGPPCRFGAPGAMRRELTDRVLAGVKTATAGLLVEFALDGEAVPQPGTRSAIIDDDEQVVAVMVTARLEIVRLADVTWEFADDEGEGFVDVDDWRRQHEVFWKAFSVPALREGFDPDFALTDDTEVVCEWFTIEPVEEPFPWPGAPEHTSGAPS
jgi:uncharacterized protein YhfF